MSVCPQKNSPQWRSLSKVYGEGVALALFTANSYEVPSLERAQSLFSLSRETADPGLDFDATTLEQVSKFLEKIGVNIALEKEIRDSEGNLVDARAAAHILRKTVSILDNEERGRNWDELPEEAAHFWFKLLPENHTLRWELEDAIVGTEIWKEVVAQYGEAYNHNDADLREEAIGKAIALNIKQLEVKRKMKQGEEDINNSWFGKWYRQFVEWIKGILYKYRDVMTQPFQLAAQQIINSDVKELLPIDQVIATYGAAEIGQEGLQEAASRDGITIAESPALEAEDFIKPRKGRFTRLFIADMFIERNADKIVQYSTVRSFEPLKEEEKAAFRRVKFRLKAVDYFNSKKSKKNTVVPIREPLFKLFKDDGTPNNNLSIPRREAELVEAVRQMVMEEHPEARSMDIDAFNEALERYAEETLDVSFSLVTGYDTYHLDQVFPRQLLDEGRTAFNPDSGMRHKRILFLKDGLKYTQKHTFYSGQFVGNGVGWLTYVPYKVNGKKVALIHETQTDILDGVDKELDADMQALQDTLRNLESQAVGFSINGLRLSNFRDKLMKPIYDRIPGFINIMGMRMAANNLDALLDQLDTTLEEIDENLFMDRPDSITETVRHEVGVEIENVLYGLRDAATKMEESFDGQLYYRRNQILRDIASYIQKGLIPVDDLIEHYLINDDGKVMKNAVVHPGITDFGDEYNPEEYVELEKVETPFDRMINALMLRINEHYGFDVQAHLFDILHGDARLHEDSGGNRAGLYFSQNRSEYDLASHLANGFRKYNKERRRYANFIEGFNKGHIKSILVNRLMSKNEEAKRNFFKGRAADMHRAAHANRKLERLYALQDSLSPRLIYDILSNVRSHFKLLQEQTNLKGEELNRGVPSEVNARRDALVAQTREEMARLDSARASMKHLYRNYLKLFFEHGIINLKAAGYDEIYFTSGRLMTKLESGALPASLYAGPDEVMDENTFQEILRALYEDRTAVSYVTTEGPNGGYVDIKTGERVTRENFGSVIKDIDNYTKHHLYDVLYERSDGLFPRTGRLFLEMSNIKGVRMEHALLPGTDHIVWKLDTTGFTKERPDFFSLRKNGEVPKNTSKQKPRPEDTLLPENKVIFERLQAQGLITKKLWKGNYFVPKQGYAPSTGAPYSDYRERFIRYQTDALAAQQLQAFIRHNNIHWLEVAPSKSGNAYIVRIIPDRSAHLEEKFFQHAGREAFERLANRLSERLGVKYKVITPEEAEEITRDARIPWNGEGAFAFKDTVYVLEQAVSLENGIHEFAHFFVRAVTQQSPYLAQKLYAQLQADPLGQEIIAYVRQNYADFPQEHQVEEVLVRAITTKALGMVDPQTGSVITEVVKKIWGSIKTIIRNLFGVSVKGLDENTTLDQLAAILLGQEEGTIVDLGKSSYFQDLFPVFNRQLAEDLQRIETNSVKSAISSFYEVVKEHLKRLQRDPDLSELFTVFANEQDGTILKDAKEVLKMAQQFSETLDRDRQALNSFADAIQGIEEISKRMRDHVAGFSSTTDPKEKIATFRKYSFMAREWGEVLTQFNRALERSPIGGQQNPLSQAVDTIRSNFEFINNRIQEYYQGEGLTKVFKEEIEGNIYYQAAIQRQKEQVDRLRQQVQTMPNLAGKLRREEELLRRLDLTEETIGAYLAGQMGDTNYYSMYLESYTSNPDPIVGTFTNWFLKQKRKAEVRAQERLTKFENRVAQLYKKLGFKPGDFQEIAQHLVQQEQIFHQMDDQGNPLGRNVWKFINQHGNHKTSGEGWEFVVNKLEQQAELLKKRAVIGVIPWDDYRQARQELEQFKIDYMFDEEGPLVKEARMFWYRDNVTFEAKNRRDDLINQLRENRFSDMTAEESELKHAENKRLRRQLSQLASLRAPDGRPKEGMDLQVAEAIREYQNTYGDIYEDVEIRGMFEARLEAFKNNLIDELMAVGGYTTVDQTTASDEYKNRLNQWYRDNHRIRISQKFYDDRQAILDRIAHILSSISDERVRNDLNVSERWKEIIELTKGYRDEDGQPIGTDLPESRVALIKELQEDIEAIKKALRATDELSDEEREELQEYRRILNSGQKLGSRYRRYQALKKKAKLPISEEDYEELRAAFDELKELQSKVSTPYYADMLNKFFTEMGGEGTVTQFNAGEWLEPGFIEPRLEEYERVTGKPDFRQWWEANHLRVEVWDRELQVHVEQYQRLYIWNRVVPNDELFQSLLESNDYEGLAAYQSEYVQVLKTSEYYYRKLKDEHRIQGKVGITMDSRRRWMPRPTLRTATAEQRAYMESKGIPYAKDDAFENKRYAELKNSQDEREQNLFRLLQAYTDFHLESQAELPVYARLGLEVPRLRKRRIESLDPGELSRNTKGFFKDKMEWIKAVFTVKRTPDEYELGFGNYQPEQEVRATVLTDLLGNQINSIPIKYKSWVEPEAVSMDIGHSVAAYAVSAEINKVLHEINPIANALKETLENPRNAPKDNKKAKGIINIVLEGFSNQANGLANKRGGNNRLKTIQNFLERELEGMENIQQFGPMGERIARGVMKLGAHASLALNFQAAFKNLVGGRIQNNLEAIMGQTVTQGDLLRADVSFSKITVNLFRDYYQLGGKSLETQMFLLFDPTNTLEERAGTNFSKTALRDLVDLKLLMAGQRFGELNIAGTMWMALMQHEKVQQQTPQGVKEIPYHEAWELREGVIQLKEGIDPAWGKGGSKFLQFVARVNKVNELNQGAYAKENQPELARYTLGKLFLFMRKFFIPGVVNRYAARRLNMGLGEIRQGYWIPLFQLIGDVIKGHVRSTGELKLVYTPQERGMMLRALSEIGFIVALGMLVGLLGYGDDDDEDRWDKVRELSPFEAHALYSLLLIKSETETFIIFPGMGINETFRLISTPSIAINTMRRYLKLAFDTGNWVAGREEAYYQRDTGIYEEGDVKAWADILNLIGLRSWIYGQDSESLTEAIKIYNASQRRI